MLSEEWMGVVEWGQGEGSGRREKSGNWNWYVKREKIF